MKLYNTIVAYFRGVVAEMRKVVWPTFPVLMRNLISVVVGVGLATLFVGVVDYLFFNVLGYIIK